MDDDLGDVVGRLHRAVRRALGRAGGHPALPDAQVELLRLVERHPGIGVKAAAEALGTAPNTVSTLVGELAAAGLLDRVRPPENRRAVRLALTPVARQRLSAYRALRRRLLDTMLAGLDEAARADILRAAPHLARLADLVDQVGPGDAGLTATAPATHPPVPGPPTAVPQRGTPQPDDGRPPGP